MDHHEEPARLWDPKELDGREARASLLRQRRPGIQRAVHRHSQDAPRLLQGGGWKGDGEPRRSKSENIRAGNVWIDVQQVFYRMEENVSGCYAQKPLKSIERIVKASSAPGDLVIDFFSHSGTTLLACERLGRRCFAGDVDPVYCEITIRRLERFRSRGRLGWQNGHPFEDVFTEAGNGDGKGEKSRKPRKRRQQASLFY